MDFLNEFKQWRCGANFIPSTAINQLEMWQDATFDPVTIKRELGYAADLGMKIMRVYLHDLAYEQDPSGFLRRMDEYLTIADGFDIKTLFCFFDDCWNPDFAIGPQPAPRPYTHNSGWIQSPGYRAADDRRQWVRLQKYVENVMKAFVGDPRVIGWDLYNEPGNGSAGDHDTKTGYRGNCSKPLLEAVFDWAHNVDDHQPLTVGLWSVDSCFDELNELSIDRSDVVSFHCYNPVASFYERASFMRLLANGRPVICTEYMARGERQCTFEKILPMLKKMNISAINWGLVAGKTNTIYPWKWSADQGKPDCYFHDVFHNDGRLLCEEERLVFNEVANQ